MVVRWEDSNNVLIQSLREKAKNKNTWQRENNGLKVGTEDFSRGVLHNSSHERREILWEYIFQRLQLARALQDRAIWLAFEKFTRADISQIAYEIMWLSMQIARELVLLLFNDKIMKKAWKKVNTDEGLTECPRYFRNLHPCYHFAIVLHEIALVLGQSDRVIFSIYILNNGNRIEWNPIRSVIIFLINKIGTAKWESDLLIKSMITDRSGRHDLQLSINQNYDKSWERN